MKKHYNFLKDICFLSLIAVSAVHCSDGFGFNGFRPAPGFRPYPSAGFGTENHGQTVSRSIIFRDDEQ